MKPATLHVALASGESVKADFSRVAKVTDVRSRVAVALSTTADKVSLLVGSTDLEDSTPPSALGPDACITAMVLEAQIWPEWYPAGKYVHDEKDVLKIVHRTSIDVDRG